MGLITDCTSFPSHNSRELISIQAGPASNWVGAHIWNLHENIIQKLQDNCFNPNVFSRSNEEGSVTSFRPRLIAIDTLGSLYSPQLEHTPTFSSLTHATWDGDIQTVKLDGYMCPPESTKKQIHQAYSQTTDHASSRTSNSQLWSDCLLPAVRHRWNNSGNVVVLRDYLDSSPGYVSTSSSDSGTILTMCDNKSESPSLTSFVQGSDLYRPGSSAFEYFEEIFHRLVEECDRPSGFSLSVDSDSGFAGVGLRLGEFLNEEFAKRPVFTSAIASFPTLPQECHRSSTIYLNRLALFSAMEEATNWPSSSCWAPIAACGHACFASSCLASAIVTLLSPMLLKLDHKYSSELHEFISTLTPTRKKMMSLSMVCQDPNSLFEVSDWTHASTFNLCQTSVNKSRPRSLVCQFSTRGFTMDESEFSAFLPHPDGHACSLSDGTEPKLSCCLPSAPLNVPHPYAALSPTCTQPPQLHVHTILEAVSHWTAEDQWLAGGLKFHVDRAFRKSPTTHLEVDELHQLRESAMDRLVEAYASAD